jgi:hypothetical protein
LAERSRSALYVLTGAVAFAAAQAVLFLVAGESNRPTIDSNGWFLNSTTGIAVVATVTAAACAAASRAWPAATLWRGWAAFVGGAALAFLAALFGFGPGTIFPIVIVAGLAVIGVGALAGSAVARMGLRRGRAR